MEMEIFQDLQNVLLTIFVSVVEQEIFVVYEIVNIKRVVAFITEEDEIKVDPLS